jgi:hypothetical protein
VTIDYQAKKHKTFPSKQPLYRYWDYLCKKSLDKNIIMQKSWRTSYEKFSYDVGIPPTSDTHYLVMFDPEQGYVWSNVIWLLRKRYDEYEPLVWLRYRGVRKEITQWATEFGTTLHQFRKYQAQGWTIRKIEAHCKKVRELKAIDKAKADKKLRQASVAVPNPNI